MQRFICCKTCSCGWNYVKVAYSKALNIWPVFLVKRYALKSRVTLFKNQRLSLRKLFYKWQKSKLRSKMHIILPAASKLLKSHLISSFPFFTALCVNETTKVIRIGHLWRSKLKLWTTLHSYLKVKQALT